MTEITVEATRWARGWELEISEHEHTQVRRLSDARQQVVDYLDTVYPQVDHSDWEINIVPSLDGLGEQIKAAKDASKAAAQAQEDAAAQTRAVVRQLLADGVSGTDAAIIMGVSKGRISQLAKA